MQAYFSFVPCFSPEHMRFLLALKELNFALSVVALQQVTVRLTTEKKGVGSENKINHP